MTPSEFQLKVSNAKDLDFGTIISQSIELFKKSWLQGFLLQLFVMILVLPFFIVLYVPIIMLAVSQVESGNFDPDDMNGLFEGFSVLYLIVLFIGIFIIGVVQVALTSAFFRILKTLDQGGEVKTSDLFYFLKKQYVGKILVLMLASILIAIPAVLFFYLPFIYVFVPMSFFLIVFSFNPEWTVGDVVGNSFRIGNKKWLLTFGLFLISYMAITVLSFVSCGLGSLFLAPFLYHPIYFIYKETIGFDDVSELDQIGKDTVF